MGILKQFRSYILEEDFTFSVYPNKIDILNYDSIGHFDSNKVIIRYDKGTLVITGENLVVSKLMHDEVLVLGNIKNIELR
ncbi:MAG: YabP/YqfC family sporulation protein [Bacilli bacterium]